MSRSGEGKQARKENYLESLLKSVRKQQEVSRIKWKVERHDLTWNASEKRNFKKNIWKNVENETKIWRTNWNWDKCEIVSLSSRFQLKISINNRELRAQSLIGMHSFEWQINNKHLKSLCNKVEWNIFPEKHVEMKQNFNRSTFNSVSLYFLLCSTFNSVSFEHRRISMTFTLHLSICKPNRIFFQR